jgi:hypothetical protein
MVKKNISKTKTEKISGECCDLSVSKTELCVCDFALAGGRVMGLIVALSTIAGIYGFLGGFSLFNSLLLDIYGTLGYSISWKGVLLGAIYGFIDGVILFGLLAFFYNKGCLFKKGCYCCAKR